VRVPFVIAGPGIRRRGVRDEKTLVSGVDVVPTLCDYAGVSASVPVTGRSLRAAVEGGDLNRPFVVSEISEYGKETPEARKSPSSASPPSGLEKRQGRMLRTDRYKYVVFNGGDRPEQLFDLQLDPGEVYNLARRTEAAPTLEQHREMLLRWIEGTRDDFRMP
jgi:arylsulfatase A-like enzyme